MSCVAIVVAASLSESPALNRVKIDLYDTAGCTGEIVASGNLGPLPEANASEACRSANGFCNQGERTLAQYGSVARSASQRTDAHIGGS